MNKFLNKNTEVIDKKKVEKESKKPNKVYNASSEDPKKPVPIVNYMVNNVASHRAISSNAKGKTRVSSSIGVPPAPRNPGDPVSLPTPRDPFSSPEPRDPFSSPEPRDPVVVKDSKKESKNK